MISHMHKECQICGADFSVKYICQLKRKFCSHKCSLINMHKKNIKTKISVNCKDCSQSFTPEVHMVGKQLFCSAICFNNFAKKEKIRVGKNNGHWKGGITNHDGYLRITHGKESSKYHHRKIMENHLGRPLTNLEVVHHINGNKSDNRIENLQVMDRATHMNIHRDELRGFVRNREIKGDKK